ncbi:MORC family CW-type zinc finger protein 3-like isoform X3 [Stegostoma tigrinum]|uniref:MORC family CW-type zinc finger protein 3-like isoform X3 n=1 Tax=Stegostoma tigrinum TaxID=3053191 RepID=UPI00286FC4C8|nr:MORC family CW-type zinc finger protein 3-like isoform X3 [Stegostoma tigrinum]
MAKLSEHGIRLSAMSPTYLHTNSTSHTWPFSAIAELIDNACDPGVCAKQMWIDVTKIKNELCLTFMDNGNGMTPIKLHKMLSFGFTNKTGNKNHLPIGVYGNGFKSGSMRLGKDALVFTKNGGALSVGLLSQTYLEQINAQAVIVPIVPFNQQNNILIVTEDSVPSLEAILKYSIFNSEKELLAEFDAIVSKKGTRIIIWNIRRNKDGKPELDFETDPLDIQIPDINSEDGVGKKKTYRRPERQDQHIPESDYSLRAYCSILYLKPRIQIILCKKKVKAQLITKSLAHIEYDVYKPNFNNKRVKITFGFNCKNKEQYGIMMYNKNRLIKSYEKVGCQIKSTSRGCGVGVIGIIECNFLKPAHNKQDFEYTKEYRLTMQALGQKLNDYWKEKKTKKNQEEADSTDLVEERTVPDQAWVQCETCMKWRKLPPEIDPESLPENWYCNMNPDPKFRSCSIPEEPEQSDDEMTPSYEKASKKHDQCLERKRQRSLEQEKLMIQCGPIPSSHRTLQHYQLASTTQKKDNSEARESDEERAEEEEVGCRTRSCSASLSTASGCSDNMNEEHVVSSSQGLNSNKRKQSPRNKSWNKKRFKGRAEILANTSLLDAAQSMEYDTVNSIRESKSNSSDDDLIIIDDGANEGSRSSITHHSPKQEKIETVDFLNLNCANNVIEENSSNDTGPIHHATAEKLLISEGTQTNKLAVIKKIEIGSNETREPTDSHSNLRSQEDVLTRKANEIDPSTRNNYTAATVHFLEKQLDQARNLLDERTTERDCFRKDSEEQAITIEQITKQLMEYQENERQQVQATLRASLMENINIVGPEGWSLEEIKAYYKKIVHERDDLAQQLEDAVKKVENCSSENKQLKEQLGKVEQERDQFKLEYEKMKQDLKASTNRGDDFYWTKKSAAAYRYSELELMRSEVEKLKGQKVELEEKLEEALRCNALCKEAWDPSTSQEVAQANSVLTKLKSLRVKVGHLLGSVLPHLDLKDISYETDIIDEILEKVIEANKL